MSDLDKRLKKRLRSALYEREAARRRRRLTARCSAADQSVSNALDQY